MDDNGLPPLPTPNDTVTQELPVTPVVSDTVTPTSPPATEGQAPVTPPPAELEKPKKKSNMKVVVGMVVALFLVGASIAVSVLFPGFRGDLRQRASWNYCDENPENCTAGGGPPPGDHGAPDGGGCNQEPVRCWDGSEVNGCTGTCPSQGGGGPPPGDHGAPDGGGCNQEPVRCWDGSEVNGCTGTCPSQGGGGPTSTVTSTVTSTPGVGGGGGACEGAQNASCCAGKSPGQVTCGGSIGYCSRGTSGCSFDFAKICIPNECYHTGTGDEGRLCASDGLGYVVDTKCYANPTVWTCGCDLGNEVGSVGPQTCWNKQTGGSVKKEPLVSGCKGSTGQPTPSGTPSTTVTAPPPGGNGGNGGGGGGSSSSSSGGGSGGGTAPMCVETRVYLKKADGTFDTVATPIAQLSSKISIGNVIRLAIRGNLANFTKGRFIIKKDAVVLETRETTTKNNLPGDAATFEYIYDYTIISGGTYSIEGAVWQ